MIHTLATIATIATRAAGVPTTPAPPLRRVRACAVRCIAHRADAVAQRVARHIDHADAEAVAHDAVDLLLASGYSLSVTASTVRRSRDLREILRTLRVSDGGVVECHDLTGEPCGYVHLDYRNGPGGALVDYAGPGVSTLMRCVQVTTADKMR